MPDRPDIHSQRAAELRRRADAAKQSGGAPDIEVAALRYDTGQENAPKVIAHGRGHAAQKILDLAAEHDVPVSKDPTLVAILGALDVGTEIPPDLYGVIAEVLAWAYHADKAVGAKRELAQRSRAA
ncbi:MAG: EscU/YscU/HrcU family type III secretion system export apparatus switch protein [Thermoleophilia bacterium]|nr:EscU/YscU/HrcU family type III secretion system export apparatus switch protein [Thermoleophilia bacterium]